jgi:hypothetical protein
MIFENRKPPTKKRKRLLLRKKAKRVRVVSLSILFNQCVIFVEITHLVIFVFICNLPRLFLLFLVLISGGSNKAFRFKKKEITGKLQYNEIE